VACARHMQPAHPHKNRLAGTAASGAAAPVVYGPLASLSAAPGPKLLNPGAPAPNVLPPPAPPMESGEMAICNSTVAGEASHDDAGDLLERDNPPAIVCDPDDDTPDLMSDTESGDDDEACGFHSDDDVEGFFQARGRARLQARGRTRLNAAVHAARQLQAALRDDGMERGVIGGSARRRPVFWTSTAARIRAYYESMREASKSVQLVDRDVANRSSRFASPALRGALRFSLTAGGGGLSEGDNVRFADVIMDAERAATAGTTAVGAFCAAFETLNAFLTAAREEQARVLARLRWMEVPIEIGDTVYTYYYRDVLTAGLDALARAAAVDFGEDGPFGGGTTASDQLENELPELDDEDESRERRGSLDSDLYQQERHNVRAVHGREAVVMGVQLHADEALVSSSGAHNIFPVRARFVNAVSLGGGWSTVGYIEHVPRAVGQTPARRLEVSDVRNDLLQRCLAVSLRALTRASESGVTAPVSGRGDTLLVPRIVGIVVDHPEERAIYSLMGNRCRFFCSPCMADKGDVPSASAIRAVDRDVVQTLDAQLEAAIVRRHDPRPARRRALGQEHSALVFAPAFGAVHGLSTGSRFLYKTATFDLLHVWKLDVLRLLAQRLPVFLTTVFPDGQARLGSATHTLDALNLRAFELDRNCKVCPSAPGYVRVKRDTRVTCAVCLTVIACLLAGI